MVAPDADGILLALGKHRKVVQRGEGQVGDELRGASVHGGYGRGSAYATSSVLTPEPTATTMNWRPPAR